MNIEHKDDTGYFEDLNGSSRLLVSFGGIEQGIGMPVYEFFNSLKKVDSDKVFLRDLNQMWYQKGVDSSLNSIHLVAERLEKVLRQGNYERVLFLGNSMGGYAAILFGVLLKVNAVLAFAPQTFIDKKSRLIKRDSRWSEQMKRVHSNPAREKKYFNLSKWMKTNNSQETQINIYYSTSDLLDVRHVRNIREYENVFLHEVLEGGHKVVKTIRDRGELIPVIKNQLF